MQDYNNKTDTPFKTTVMITFLLIFTALGLYFFKFKTYKLSNDPADWANFGAYVGGVLGTCFAFATFWMLFSTFRLQQKQLKNTEVEKFETTFYSLLELHNQKLSELNLNPNKIETLFDANPLIGQELTISDDEYMKIDDISVFTSKESKYDDTEEYLKELQKEILKDVELSQYFRILYQLLKFIARNNIKNPDRKFDTNYLCNRESVSIDHEKMYSSIVRAFVPVPLLPILALNCIHMPGGIHNLDHYQSLLERYNFLEHIRFDLLPKNLAMFVIFDNYNHALNKNDSASIIAPKLKKKYKNHPVKSNSYFLRSNENESSPIKTNKRLRENAKAHFTSLGKGFYSDEATIHEAILFLIAGISTSVFFLTFSFYVISNFSKISKIYNFIPVILISIFASILLIIALYVITITGGRLATTLARRNVSNCKTVAYIVTILPVAFFIIFIYIVILTPVSR